MTVDAPYRAGKCNPIHSLQEVFLLAGESLIPQCMRVRVTHAARHMRTIQLRARGHADDHRLMAPLDMDWNVPHALFRALECTVA